MGYPEDNLKKKGADANPNGTPLYWETYSELYKKYSLKPFEELSKLANDETMPMKHIIVIRDIIRASEGNDKPIERIQDRSDGKPVQHIEQVTHNPIEAFTDEQLQEALRDAQSTSDTARNNQA